MRILFVILMIILASPGFTTRAYAGEFGVVPGNRAFSLEVTSFKAMRFQDVIPQEYDFSCGSAALATLLNYHYNISVTEQQILDAMFAVGDQALGARKMTNAEFNKIWNDIFFVIRNRTEEARLSFREKDTWPARRQKLFTEALSNQALGTFSVHTTLSPNIYY